MILSPSEKESTYAVSDFNWGAMTYSSDEAPAVAPWVPFPIWSFFLPFFLPR